MIGKSPKKILAILLLLLSVFSCSRNWDNPYDPNSENFGVVWTGSHNLDIASLNFNSTGSTLVSTSFDSTIKCWNAFNGDLLWEKRQDSYVFAASISPDDRTVVTVDYRSAVKVYDLRTGEIEWVGEHSPWVMSVLYNHAGTRIATGAENIVKLWDANTGSLLWSGENPIYISALAFSPNDSIIVTGSGNRGTIDSTMGFGEGINNIKAWDVSTGNHLWTRELSGKVKYLDISPDGSMVVSGNEDRTARAWDIHTGNLLWSYLISESSGVPIVKFNSSGNSIIISDHKYIVKLDANSGNSLWRYETSSLIRFMAISFNGSRIALVSERDLLVIDPEKEEELWSGRYEGEILDYFEFGISAINPEGSLIVTGDNNGNMIAWAVEEGYEVIFP
jgi:WD40 repeat protein